MSEIPWRDIELAYKSGVSMTKLAKQYGITRQAISKHVKKHGIEKTEVAPRNWAEIASQSTPVGAKDTPETRAQILECLSQGMTLKAASQYALISEDTLRRWREQDQAFAAQIITAQRIWHQRQLEKLEGSQDPKWAAWQLERHPVTREEYQPGDKGSNRLQVTVNVGRATHEQIEQVKVYTGDIDN